MLFAVLAADEPERLAVAIRAAFPSTHLVLGPGQWLIAAGGTARDVAGALGLEPGDWVGTALVISVAGYWGVQGVNVWEWCTAYGARSEVPPRPPAPGPT